MEKEFELFLRERRYVQNVAENTIEYYRICFRAFKRYLGVGTINELNKPELINLVANMRAKGLTSAGTNSYIREINPFLT